MLTITARFWGHDGEYLDPQHIHLRLETRLLTFLIPFTIDTIFGTDPNDLLLMLEKRGHLFIFPRVLIPAPSSRIAPYTV